MVSPARHHQATSATPERAIGAVVARFVHTEEVTGSNPVSPTKPIGDSCLRTAQTGSPSLFVRLRFARRGAGASPPAPLRLRFARLLWLGSRFASPGPSLRSAAVVPSLRSDAVVARQRRRRPLVLHDLLYVGTRTSDVISDDAYERRRALRVALAGGRQLLRPVCQRQPCRSFRVGAPPPYGLPARIPCWMRWRPPAVSSPFLLGGASQRAPSAGKPFEALLLHVWAPPQPAAAVSGRPGMLGRAALCTVRPRHAVAR
jgi:hypothetical protein